VANTLVHFRELTTLDELEAYFHLRYLVYRQSGYLYLPPCVDELDIDPYDFRSRFLGAFARGDDGVERLVGGIRMVRPYQLSPQHALIFKLVEGARDAALARVRPSEGRLPSEQYFDLKDVLEDCRARGLELVEFSRTVCAAEARGLNVGYGLVNGIFGYAIKAGLELGIGSAPPNIQAFYEKLGCRPIPSKSGYYDGLRSELCAMLVPLREFPYEVQTAAERFGQRLLERGYFCLCERRDCVLTEYLQPLKSYACADDARILASR
jgi:hypothetical protein